MQQLEQNKPVEVKQVATKMFKDNNQKLYSNHRFYCNNDNVET